MPSPQLKSLDGRRFGSVVVLRYAGSKPGPSRGRGLPNVQPYWLVRCDCEREVEALGSKLRRGKRTSCNDKGCPYRNNGMVRTFRHACRSVYLIYKSSAADRGYEWGLTEDIFFALVSQRCHYTGAPPQKEIPTREGVFRWNGIDRKDNTKGYVLGNVLPCSEFANRAKMTRTYDEFIAWLDRAAEFRRESSMPSKKHPGFKGARKKIESEGYSKKSAGAILASAARKASASAKKKNPKLAKVKGKAK